MSEKFDVIVIGSGQGGDPFARECANRGKKTALIERDKIGGTCINTGCTPTKTMIACGRVAYLAKRGNEYGTKIEGLSIDMKKIRSRKQDVVLEFRESGERKDLETPNLHLVRESAMFTGLKTVEAGARKLSAEVIVIDTGSIPFIPPVPGLDRVKYLDNESIMELDEVPGHLIVLGGGYIGVEFAQLFRRLGSKVTVIERAGQIVSREDGDVSEALTEIFREDGIEILINTEVNAVSEGKSGIRVQAGARTLEGSHLLIALGRTPNIKDLQPGKAGIEVTDKGAIRVNQRLETNVPGVYAIGDVNGGPQFTHISYDDFRILRDNLLDEGRRTTMDRPTPYTVFTDPQLGRIGLSEKEANRTGVSYRVAKLPMSSVARAIETGESRGFMKALVNPDSKQILGAAILGPEGGEIANMIQIAMMGKLPYTALRDGVFSHPTLGESLNNLFMTLDS